MALTVVGSSVGNATVSPPAGTSSGDFMLLSSMGPAPTSPPSGWTLQANATGTYNEFALYSKTAGSSEGSVSKTDCGLSMLVLRNVSAIRAKTGNFAGHLASAGDIPLVVPGVTTDGAPNDNFILAILGQTGPSDWFSLPANYTTIASATTGSPNLDRHTWLRRTDAPNPTGSQSFAPNDTFQARMWGQQITFAGAGGGLSMLV